MMIRKDLLVEAFSVAIAKFEGFYDPKHISSKFKNPGNLRWWPGVESGTTRGGEVYALFPTVDLGWKALKTQIRTNIGRGLTFLEFFAGVRDASGKPIVGRYSGYAPTADGNKPQGYAHYIVNTLNNEFDTDFTLHTVIKDVIK